MATPAPAAFAELLQKAVTDPGIISAAYSQFHSFSIGNQILAWTQCQARSLQPGPIATYQRWKDLGSLRQEGRKGDHAVPTSNGQAHIDA